MERIEYRGVVNKVAWPRGPWDNEPDKIQWQDEDTGLPCLIVRGPTGALCGYVGVAEGHPWYHKTYHDLPAQVHGGLTFSHSCSEGSESEEICHRPSEGEPDHVWWLGFDCVHAWDFSPAYAAGRDRNAFIEREIYREIPFVEAECRALAKQVRAIT